MTKQEIQEKLKILKAMVLVYHSITFISDEDLRIHLFRKMVKDSTILFADACDWIDEHRNGYLKFELWSINQELYDAHFYDFTNREYVPKIEKGIEYIERSIFKKNL